MFIAICDNCGRDIHMAKVPKDHTVFFCSHCVAPGRDNLQGEQTDRSARSSIVLGGTAEMGTDGDDWD